VKGIAAGVLVGYAAWGLVQTLVTGVLSPLLAQLFGDVQLYNLEARILGADLEYGSVLMAGLGFVIAVAVAAWLISGRLSSTGAGRLVVGQRPCPECTEPVAAAAKRCPHCTAQIELGPA
jgi:large conductance mechanosensitive channel